MPSTPYPNTTHLNVNKLCRTYASGQQGVAALREISFTAAKGEFLAVRGPSGCGKSTLLHILGGMDRPTSGSVSLGELRLDQLRHEQLAEFRRRHVGFIFQAFHLLPTLTVLENVTLPQELDGKPAAAATGKASELLERVGLSDKQRRYPAELSGGEMQRVAIARAVAHDPQLLLADEPTGSLDSENGQLVLNLLQELNRSLGLSIVLATHAPEAAHRADRVLFIRDGEIERIEKTDRVFTTT